MNKELITKCEQLKMRVKDLERQVKTQADELEGARCEETRQCQETVSYRDNIAHLVLTIHRLAEQKRILARMLTASERMGRDVDRAW